MSPDAYANFKLSTQGGNAAFSFALIQSLGEAVGRGPSDVYVYPLNMAMAAQAVYDSVDAAGSALAVLASRGISFHFNGVLVNCNATLAVPPAAQKPRLFANAGSAIVPVTVVQALMAANFTTLGVTAFEGYGGLQLAMDATVHSLLGQAGKRLSDVVLRPSRDDASMSDVLFIFTDESVGEAFEALLAAGEVKLRWNNATYLLQPQQGRAVLG
jgi:hypothetical protein